MLHRQVLIFICVVLFCMTAFGDNNLDQVIANSRTQIFKMREPNGLWKLPAYLGLYFVSEEYLTYQWLGHTETSLNNEKLKTQIIRSQQSDGSWYAAYDANLESSGDLDASILNYWTLKGMGVSADSPNMLKAKTYILKKGGLEASNIFTKGFLCLFGNYGWSKMGSIPLLMFARHSPIKADRMAVWVSPNLIPLAYLKKVRAQKNLGPNFDIRELAVNWQAIAPQEPKTDILVVSKKEEKLIHLILSRQQPHGSSGGYTLSTLLSLAALSDYTQRTHGDNAVQEEVTLKTSKAFQFVDEELSPKDASEYNGVFMDSRYWDATLLAQGLFDAGLEDQVQGTADYLATFQNAQGGFLFGQDFDYAPDVDDTAEELLLLERYGRRYQRQIDLGIQFLLGMQNKDGGWGAFAKNNKPNIILRKVTQHFAVSEELFDLSYEDVTGHILEAFARAGYNATNSEPVKHAVAFLKKKQNKKIQAWRGRWGVNYIYGTSAVVIGLIAAGEDPNSSYIQNSIKWLTAHQNPDGGFGETTYSYFDINSAGTGISTVTQTAWALETLVAAGLAATPAAKGAADYLVKEYLSQSKWQDQSVTATAFPKVMSMVYPSYPYAFSLLGLTRYRTSLLK